MRPLLSLLALGAVLALARPGAPLAQVPRGQPQPLCVGEGCGGGDVTPPTVALAYPQGDVYTATDSIVIEWCDDLELSAASRSLTVNGVPRSTSYTNVIPTECGAHKRSTATAVPLNLGANTVVAHICDGSSNCTTETFTVTRRVGPLPVLSLAPYSPDLQDYGRCAAACFAVTYAHGTVPYYSLDTPRNVTLVYNSGRAEARPFIHVDVTHGGDGSNVPSYFTLRATRADGTLIQFVNGGTVLHFAASAGAALRLGGQLVAASNGMDSTGVYPVTLIVGAVYPDGVVEDTASSRLIVVKDSAAGLGTGWSVAGLQRLYVQADSSVLVVEGGGAAVYFQKSGSSYVTPSGDFSRLTRSGTVYTRAWADSTTVSFNGAG